MPKGQVYPPIAALVLAAYVEDRVVPVIKKAPSGRPATYRVVMRVFRYVDAEGRTHECNLRRIAELVAAKVGRPVSVALVSKALIQGGIDRVKYNENHKHTTSKRRGAPVSRDAIVLPVPERDRPLLGPE